MHTILEDEYKRRFIDRINQLQPDSKSLWGKMNVNQMLAHMNDAFRLILNMTEAKDKSNWFTNKIVFNVAVYLMPQWPKGLMTAAELNQDKLGTTPKDFYVEVEMLKKMMDIFEERDESKLGFHPMFGKLTKSQAADLLTKHLDHHLKQFGV